MIEETQETPTSIAPRISEEPPHAVDTGGCAPPAYLENIETGEGSVGGRGEFSHAPTSAPYSEAEAAWPIAEEFSAPTKYTCRTLDKTGDKEPIFVLRAQDICAPHAIRCWADYLQSIGGSPEKIAHALCCADSMEAWGRANVRKVPD